jgi:lincosamide nucleotidyltransferase A/C/D/E
MKAEDVAELYRALESLSITVWLDGGWAVDALLGEQTRPHEDVDIVIQEKDISALRKYLESQNYHDVIRDDTSFWNFVLGDNSDRLVDIHVIRFDKEGNGLYGPKGEMYPEASLAGVGKVDDVTVKCISAEHLVKFHTGYKVDEKDYKDVTALCNRFNLELPREYVGFNKNMKIMVFTEGTVLIFSSGKGLSREKILELSRSAGVQREGRSLAFENDTPLPEVPKGSVYDFTSYIPVGGAVEKLKQWKEQGAVIYYLTSRRIKIEIENIKNVLDKYHFPDFKNIVYRQKGEDYKDVAEKLMPDVLIEDDCESIGGEVEMTYPHINPQKKQLIKSIVVREFSGIDQLPDRLTSLLENA